MFYWGRYGCSVFVASFFSCYRLYSWFSVSRDSFYFGRRVGWFFTFGIVFLMAEVGV